MGLAMNQGVYRSIRLPWVANAEEELKKNWGQREINANTPGRLYQKQLFSDPRYFVWSRPRLGGSGALGVMVGTYSRLAVPRIAVRAPLLP